MSLIFDLRKYKMIIASDSKQMDEGILLSTDEFALPGKNSLACGLIISSQELP